MIMMFGFGFIAFGIWCFNSYKYNRLGVVSLLFGFILITIQCINLAQSGV